MYVLGIDAGGTKTVCLLSDDTGRVLAESHAGGANLQASGEQRPQRDIQAKALHVGITGIASITQAA